MFTRAPDASDYLQGELSARLIAGVFQSTRGRVEV
jgi:hypothetical protein